MVEKYADSLIINFSMDDILNFILIFEKIGFEIMIKKIPQDHPLFECFVTQYLTMYRHERDRIPEVEQAIIDYFIELTKNDKASIRWCGISALGNINYENKKEYFTELLKTEQNKMIIALLDAHLRPLNT